MQGKSVRVSEVAYELVRALSLAEQAWASQIRTEGFSSDALALDNCHGSAWLHKSGCTRLAVHPWGDDSNLFEKKCRSTSTHREQVIL